MFLLRKGFYHNPFDLSLNYKFNDKPVKLRYTYSYYEK
jgi:hypothetical protein